LIAVLPPGADPVLAARAERLIGRLGSAAIEPLIVAVQDHRAGPAAVRAAGLLRDSRAVEPLVRLLRDPDADLRAAAADALGRLNDTRSVPALVSCTQDPEQSVRDSASAALERMGPAGVIVAVVTLLGPRDGQLDAADGGPRGVEEAVTQLLSRGDGSANHAPARDEAEPATRDKPGEPLEPAQSAQPVQAVTVRRPASRRSRLLSALQSAFDPQGPDGAGPPFPR
jgi:hypothetical protein